MDPANPQTDKKADFLLHILEAIGAPLMSAITDAAPAGQDNPQNEAQTMAALLGKTVEASIDLGNIMQINPAEAQDDTLDRKSTRLNSSHDQISYAVFCLKKKI